MLRTLRFRNAEDAAHAGVRVTPYAQRSVGDLLYTAAVLRQRNEPLPTGLQAELFERGVSASSI